MGRNLKASPIFQNDQSFHKKVLKASWDTTKPLSDTLEIQIGKNKEKVKTALREIGVGRYLETRTEGNLRIIEEFQGWRGTAAIMGAAFFAGLPKKQIAQRVKKAMAKPNPLDTGPTPGANAPNNADIEGLSDRLYGQFGDDFPTERLLTLKKDYKKNLPGIDVLDSLRPSSDQQAFDLGSDSLDRLYDKGKIILPNGEHDLEVLKEWQRLFGLAPRKKPC